MYMLYSTQNIYYMAIFFATHQKHSLVIIFIQIASFLFGWLAGWFVRTLAGWLGCNSTWTFWSGFNVVSVAVLLLCMKWMDGWMEWW